MQHSWTVTEVDIVDDATIQDRIRVYEQAIQTMDPATDAVWIDRYTNLINTLNQEINNA